MKIEKLFQYSAEELKRALYSELLSAGYSDDNMHNEPKFLYAEGNAPYMLVAHLDTVHKDRADVICYSKDGNFIMSPYGIGGDDRCGVYIILALLKKLDFKPYIVFTMEEETGGRGASAFINYMRSIDLPDLKYIVEYDRRGRKDCVFYQCDNRDFVKFVEKFGFKEATGTFSDISIIAPYFGVAAVNLASGYYYPHTNHEVVSVRDMHNIIDMSLKMFNEECDNFKYVKKTYSYPTTYYDREVEVTMLPAGIARVYDYYSEPKYRDNLDDEIAISKDGSLYKYSTYSKGFYKTTYSAVSFINGYVPMYDHTNATVIKTY